jgi:hypothetical protein
MLRLVGTPSLLSEMLDQRSIVLHFHKKGLSLKEMSDDLVAPFGADGMVSCTEAHFIHDARCTSPRVA